MKVEDIGMGREKAQKSKKSRNLRIRTAVLLGRVTEMRRSDLLEVSTRLHREGEVGGRDI